MLAILYTVNKDAQGRGEGGDATCSLEDAMCVLRWTVSALPILSTFLLSCNSRFSPVNKWRQLKAAAANVKSEIYLYRTRVGDYAPLVHDKLAQLALLSGEAQRSTAKSAPDGQSTAAGSGEAVDVEGTGSKTGGDTRGTAVRSRRALFAEALEGIQSTLMNGEIGKSALVPTAEAAAKLFENYRKESLHGNQSSSLKDAKVRETRRTGEDSEAGVSTGGDQKTAKGALQDYAHDEARDDGIAPISAEEYITFRLQPELKRYEKLTPRLSTLMTVLQTTVFLASAANAVLAITKRLEYVPLLVALTGSVSAVMEYEMLSVRLLAYNNAQMALGNLLIWWQSLSLIDRRTADAKRYLVEGTEEALHVELAWIRSNRRKPAGSKMSQENAGKEKAP